MAFSCFAGSFNPGTTLNNTVAVTGVGFQPKAILFWWSGRTESTDTAGSLTIQRGVGFCAGTADRRCCGSRSEDNAGTAACDSGHRADSFMTEIADGAFGGRVDLQSFDSDGFTSIVDAVLGADYRISFLALGGSDLTNVETGVFTPSSTSQTVTTGFLGDCVFFFATPSQSDAPALAVDSLISFGAAAGDAASPVMWTLYAGSNDTSGTQLSRGYNLSSECVAMHTSDPANLNMRGAFTGFNAGPNYTISWTERSSACRVHYMVLKGGSYKVGNVLTQTDTTTDIVAGSFGFQPTGLLFASCGRAASTADTPSNHDMWSIGAGTSTTNRVSQAVEDTNGVGTSVTTAALETDEVYINIDTADAVQGLMDIKSIDAGGFTCIMDDADPAQSFVGYVAFGNTIAASTTGPGYEGGGWW